jgi:hypothetical protein
LAARPLASPMLRRPLRGVTSLARTLLLPLSPSTVSDDEVKRLREAVGSEKTDDVRIECSVPRESEIKVPDTISLDLADEFEHDPGAQSPDPLDLTSPAESRICGPPDILLVAAWQRRQPPSHHV